MPSNSTTRLLLWVLVIIALAANAITSLAGLTAVSVVLGVVTLGLGALLVRDHLRRRVRS